MGIPNFVRGYDPGPDRSVSVEGFAEHPLRRSELPITHRHVITDAVAEDDFGGALLGNMATAFADYDYQLSFVINQRRRARNLDWDRTVR